MKNHEGCSINRQNCLDDDFAGENCPFVCNQCRNTGLICIANGPEDVQWEGCPTCHKEPVNYGLLEDEAKKKYLLNLA